VGVGIKHIVNDLIFRRKVLFIARISILNWVSLTFINSAMMIWIVISDVLMAFAGVKRQGKLAFFHLTVTLVYSVILNKNNVNINRQEETDVLLTNFSLLIMNAKLDLVAQELPVRNDSQNQEDLRQLTNTYVNL
jgi:hypothetical protein